MSSILLFDSGVGGVSIYQHIRQRLPEASIHYLADTARFPYGELSEPDLIQGCIGLIQEHIQRYDTALVVIACNSASTLVLQQLRSRVMIPVVGVVPAIKPAAELSCSGRIGLLATPGTVQRQYTDALIDAFAPQHQVIRIGSSELVRMAEAKMAGQTPNRSALTAILQPLLVQQPDVVVLGCTHFPLLVAELQEVLGSNMQLVDSGAAVARQVEKLCRQSALTLERGDGARFFYTGSQPGPWLFDALKRQGFGEVRAF
ncbi:glutamate racemase [Ferrimonas pelagia]|uniref:Glutamate racemase n=1 Tax=Ferrimonas pelagia TaxID=1177826 RepID=A0ABP9F005_9GAMM